MRLATHLHIALAALLVILPAGAARAQRVADLRSAVPPLSSEAGKPEGRAQERGVVHLAPATKPPGTWAELTQDRPPRWPKYALVGGVVGFVGTALIARSMICPGTDCIDSGEASFPIFGVVFYGVLGGGVGALVGAGVGAFVDARAREAAPSGVAPP